MQGLWSAHRRAKININGNTPPSAPTTPIPTPTQEPVTPQPVEEPESAEQPVPQAVPPTPEFEEGSSAPAATAPISTTGKRKTRTTRTNDDGSKRIKLANPPPKDFTPPAVRLSDIGGADSSIDTMRELVIMPLQHPEVYLHIGVQPARGILLHGPPGCGKTLLAHAIAGVRYEIMNLCMCQANTNIVLRKRACLLLKYLHPP